ncbi:hypothetical protein CL652_02315 [bacterium]|nr:hypothetical protein [bacterium]|tara:strand:- start:13376 stop:13729 length:354 start_codon:yes stop_codon:yes gene_type:complete
MVIKKLVPVVVALALGGCTTIRSFEQEGVLVRTVEDKSLYGPSVKIVTINEAGKEPIVYAATGPDILTSVAPAVVSAATGLVIANSARCTQNCGDQLTIATAAAISASQSKTTVGVK